MVTATHGKQWHDLAWVRWISLHAEEGMSRETPHAQLADRIPSSDTCKSQSSRLDAAIRSSRVIVLGSVPANALRRTSGPSWVRGSSSIMREREIWFSLAYELIGLPDRISS